MYLIQLWQWYWVNQIEKMNGMVGTKNRLLMSWGNKYLGLVHHLQGKNSGNVLVALYWKSPMGRSDTSFGVK